MRELRGVRGERLVEPTTTGAPELLRRIRARFACQCLMALRALGNPLRGHRFPKPFLARPNLPPFFLSKRTFSVASSRGRPNE